MRSVRLSICVCKKRLLNRALLFQSLEFYFEVEFLRVPVYVYTGGEIRTINLESEFWARKKHDEISEIYINNLY